MRAHAFVLAGIVVMLALERGLGRVARFDSIVLWRG